MCVGIWLLALFLILPYAVAVGLTDKYSEIYPVCVFEVKGRSVVGWAILFVFTVSGAVTVLRLNHVAIIEWRKKHAKEMFHDGSLNSGLGDERHRPRSRLAAIFWQIHRILLRNVNLYRSGRFPFAPRDFCEATDSDKKIPKAESGEIKRTPAVDTLDKGPECNTANVAKAQTVADVPDAEQGPSVTERNVVTASPHELKKVELSDILSDESKEDEVYELYSAVRDSYFRFVSGSEQAKDGKENSEMTKVEDKVEKENSPSTKLPLILNPFKLRIWIPTPKRKKLTRQARVAVCEKNIDLVRSLTLIVIVMLLSKMPLLIMSIANLLTSVPVESVLLARIASFLHIALNWILFGAINPSFSEDYSFMCSQILLRCFCPDGCRVVRWFQKG